MNIMIGFNLFYRWFLEKVERIFMEIEKIGLETTKSLKQPNLGLIHSISLKDKKQEEKAEKIIEAWKYYDTYRRKQEGRIEASYFGFPRSEGEISKPIKEFFEKEGEFLTESYCVLSYDFEKIQKRVFYCAINPFGFNPMIQNPILDDQSGLSELKKRIKEKYRIIGRFGLQEVYTLKETFVPEYFAIGESGTYYAFHGIHIIKTESLAALLAKLFDFTKVSLIEIYKGYLSISRFDHRLEYCYDRKDFLESIYHREQTKIDFFTKFTKAEMIRELAEQLDSILAEISYKIPILYFQFEKAVGGAYELNILEQFAFECHNKAEQQKFRKGLLDKKKKLVWKLWGHSIGKEVVLREFTGILFWYMENGSYGWKLRDCLKINIGFSNFHGEIKTEETIYKNIDSILETIKERTKMTAYSLTMNKKRKPRFFDSKFGGLAYWDLKKEYPCDLNGKKLMLIAQINLDQNPMEALLLKGGMLQFFGDGEEIFCQGFGAADDQNKFRVIYHDKIDYNITKEELIAFGLPDSTEKEKGYIHMPISKELAFDVEKKEVFMNMQDYRFRKELKTAIEQRFSINIMENPYHILDSDIVADKFDYPGHWILGYSDFVGKDPRNYKEYREQFQQYDRQLFQFDVHYLDENDYYFQYGGCGVAHFFIRSQDLEQKDFSHIMYHWESCKML